MKILESFKLKEGHSVNIAKVNGDTVVTLIENKKEEAKEKLYKTKYSDITSKELITLYSGLRIAKCYINSGRWLVYPYRTLLTTEEINSAEELEREDFIKLAKGE